MELIQVQMLGRFTLQTQHNLISDADTRAKKVWSLLACSWEPQGLQHANCGPRGY